MNLMILPVGLIVKELKTFEAYLGFYPGGVRAIARDMFLGVNKDSRVWTKNHAENFDSMNLREALENYYDLEYFNLDRDNTFRYTDGFVEFEFISTMIVEQETNVCSLVENMIGVAEQITFYRGPGTKWVGDDILVGYELKCNNYQKTF